MDGRGSEAARESGWGWRECARHEQPLWPGACVPQETLWHRSGTSGCLLFHRPEARSRSLSPLGPLCGQREVPEGPVPTALPRVGQGREDGPRLKAVGVT